MAGTSQSITPSLVLVAGVSMLAAAAAGMVVKKRRRNSEREPTCTAPFPPEGPSMGEFVKAMNDREQDVNIQAWHEKYGRIFHFKSHFGPIIMCADAAIARDIMTEKSNQYHEPCKFGREPYGQRLMRLSTGGLTQYKGEEWRWRKNALLSTGFHDKALIADDKMLWEELLNQGHLICGALEKAAYSGEPIRVHELTTRAACNVIMFHLYGRADLEYDFKVVHAAGRELVEYMRYLLQHPLQTILPPVPFTSSWDAWKRITAARKVLDDINRPELEMLAQEIKTGVRREGRCPGSMMESLMRKEPRYLSHGIEKLVDSTRLLLNAGFETTTHQLAFTLEQLALKENAKVQADVAKQCQEVIGGAGLTRSMLPKLTLASGAFWESLRLLPVVVMTSGIAYEDFTTVPDLDGKCWSVKKGNNIIFNSRCIQRDPLYVKDPLLFDPARWDAAPADRPPMFTFRVGAHGCPGKNLSLLEAKVFLAMALEKFEFSRVPGKEKIEVCEAIMRLPVDGAPLLVKRRGT